MTLALGDRWRLMARGVQQMTLGLLLTVFCAPPVFADCQPAYADTCQFGVCNTVFAWEECVLDSYCFSWGQHCQQNFYQVLQDAGFGCNDGCGVYIDAGCLYDCGW